MTDDQLESARRRVQGAYDPALLPQLGDVLADSLAEHLRRVMQRDTPVLNWASPPENVRLVQDTLTHPVVDPSDLSAVVNQFRDAARIMLAHGQNLHAPRYMGHQVPATIPAAGYFDALGAITNQVNAVYEMGPWITAIEAAMSQILAGYLGWGARSFAAVVTHGGSIANLTGLLAARNVSLPGAWEQGVSRFPHAVLICHSDAHYSVARAAGLLGLGTQQLIKAPLDSRRRIDPERLDLLLGELRQAGKAIVAVVACACSTPIGAFDPLEQVAEVCAAHHVWLHVDAAHGGAALLSQQYRHLLNGIDRADTVVWDAHKMLFVPALCAFLFYRDAAHSYEAFRQDAPYLFDPSAPGLSEFDGGLRSLECTKRGAALGLWGSWSLYGPQLFTDLVDVTFALGREFYELLCETPDFIPLHEPQCNIVAFQYLPPSLNGLSPEVRGQFLRELRTQVNQSGEFYLVQTSLNGEAALRVTLINPLTNRDDLLALLATLRITGQTVLKQLAIG